MNGTSMDDSALVVFDSLEMFVTADPVAEIDDALEQALDGLRKARSAGDVRMAACFLVWINYRLDERLEFSRE